MSESLKKQYNQNGYVILRNVISTNLISRLHSHFDKVSARYAEIPAQSWNFWLFENDDEWLNLISDSEILDQVEKIIGSDIVHLGSHYWSKPPRVGNKVSWHQDGAYYDLSHMNFVTIWIALDNSTRENGCLKVIPGSHKAAFRPLAPVKHDPFLKRRMDSCDLDGLPCEYIELLPGDVSLHNPNIFHGSDSNQSERWRRGFVIKYIAGDVDIAPEMEWPWAFLVRGECLSRTTQAFLKEARPGKTKAPGC